MILIVFLDVHVEYKDFDAFHDLILFDELARCGTVSGCRSEISNQLLDSPRLSCAFCQAGLLTAVFFSFNIALPPILMAGTADQKQRIAR